MYWYSVSLSVLEWRLETKSFYWMLLLLCLLKKQFGSLCNAQQWFVNKFSTLKMFFCFLYFQCRGETRLYYVTWLSSLVILVFPVNIIYCAFPLRLLVFFWRDPSWCQSHNSSGSPVAFSQAFAGELTRAFPLAFPSELTGVFLASSVISQCDSGFSVLDRKVPFEYHLEKRYPFCLPSIEKNLLLSHAWEHCRNL